VTVIAQVVSRVRVAVHEIEALKQLLMFCGASLFVWLLTLTYGLDLSPGLF
jgi:hypothetical protein